jgi:hypothetical protein
LSRIMPYISFDLLVNSSVYLRRGISSDSVGVTENHVYLQKMLHERISGLASLEDETPVQASPALHLSVGTSHLQA